MRAYLLFAGFAGLLGITLLYPFAGLLGWTWFSFMHPQREAFGAATYFPFDFYIAVTTMVAWLIGRERKYLPLGATPLLLIAFAFWISVSTYFAIDSDFSSQLWERTEKTLIMVMFVILMSTTMPRMHAIVWIIAISLGYYAVKGAGFVITSPGGLVFGPEDSMIRDNNSLSVALATLLPLLLYLIRTSANSWIRIGTIAVACAVVITIVGTFSRGGLVALLVVGALMVLRSRARLLMGLAGIIVLVILVQSVPQAWKDRMSTILTVSSDPDASVQGRFQAWTVAWNVAKERPLIGGGFRFGEKQPVWDRYTGLDHSVPFHAAHNIYFEVLGEHGFVGLAIYVLLVVMSIRNTMIAARLAKNRDDLRPAAELANALQLSILAVAIAGNSLSIAYYDVYLTMYGLTYCVLRYVQAAVRAGRAAPQDVEAPLPAVEGIAARSRAF